MQQVTVGPKYQIVIPKELRKNRNITPGSKVALSESGSGEIIIHTDAQSWVEKTSGMMTEAWKDIDPIAQLEKMKDEWEERVKEQAKIWKSGNAKAK